MNITYHGHSTFKLKGKVGTVVTDPFSEYVGFSLPSISADIVTVSHDHPDHNAVEKVSGTSRRQQPFLITESGEYEVGGISVFGTTVFHDASQGSERGKSIAFVILIDNLRVCHLGDLGHELTPEQAEDIGNIDVLFCPVGGAFTIDPVVAVKVIRSLEPSIVVPMHYKTPLHNQDVFADMKPLSDFVREYGADVAPVKKLDVERVNLPDETELVIIDPT